MFGWFQDSFVEMEQETALNVSAGYLKGAEQAGDGARMMLNVVRTFGSASKQHCTILCVRYVGDL